MPPERYSAAFVDPLEPLEPEELAEPDEEPLSFFGSLDFDAPSDFASLGAAVFSFLPPPPPLASPDFADESSFAAGLAEE